MPLIEGPANAVAQIYARSLFELAEAKGGRANVESILGELEDILELALENPKFSEFLASRALGAGDRAKSLTKIFRGKMSDLALDFLQILNEKNRLAELPSIVSAFDGLVQSRFGRVEVDVFTAEPLAGDSLNTVRTRLSQKIGKEIILHPYTEASMIGGVKFRIGDQLIDASVATQLRNMRDKFQTNGLANLRAKIDRIIGD
jgi:F-type H+-transporting ATPase subunit delta